MALGKRRSEHQAVMWIAADQVVQAPGNPYYRRLSDVLKVEGFDAFAEATCAKFYAEGEGRPGIAPGVYFRMHMVGYLEGIGSERGICWRCADSLGLREFLGYTLTEATPDHSTLSVIRKRLDVETHQAVFRWVLEVLAKRGLLKGKTLGVDATTLEANAALRSIVRRDTGESYQEFLTRLAKASGIETPTREDLAKVDRKRPHKGSNDDWSHPHDPDARITKMKDGRTHLAHKAEHAVDMETGAVVAVTLQGANIGDTRTLMTTLAAAAENFPADTPAPMRELVADKGYHSNEIASALAQIGIRSYLSEPARGRRKWAGKDVERDAVYANRRRIRGLRGRRLMRRRGELVERPFAHCYETGRMRRTHLRGHTNILKRLLIHVAGGNLALLMRRRLGFGTPRGLADALAALVSSMRAIPNWLTVPTNAVANASRVQERILAVAAVA